METTFSAYDFAASRGRLDEILAAADSKFDEVDTMPGRDKLTFDNGFYVNCSALFVDIRGSTELAAKHKRPTMARIYRSYISETVAVLRDGTTCREVSIHGDAVWAVYDTPLKKDVDEVFSEAAKANSLVRTLNYKLGKKGLPTITVGVGMAYGRALMIKAGYKGSGINDVVWMGDVVNDASHLAGYGNKTYSDRTLMVSDVFRDNLNEHNQGLLERNWTRSCYHGNVINTAMDDWLKAQP